MGDEAVDGSKIGTKLIMFCAIIALVLVAFLVGKSLINSGVDNLETTSKSIKSALENFNGEEVIILVHTLSEGSSTHTVIADSNNIVSPTNVKQFLGIGETVNVPETMQGVAIKGDDKWDSLEAAGKGKNFFVNYNALVKSAITLKDGNYIYDDDFATEDSGNIKYNNSTDNITKKGSLEYISDGSSFKASLIKNSSGEIVGILFAQKKVG